MPLAEGVSITGQRLKGMLQESRAKEAALIGMGFDGRAVRSALRKLPAHAPMQQAVDALVSSRADKAADGRYSRCSTHR